MQGRGIILVRGTDTPGNGSGEGAGILHAEASGPDIHVSPTTSPSLLSATKGPPRRLPGRQRAGGRGGAASPLEASSSELLQGLRAHSPHLHIPSLPALPVCPGPWLQLLPPCPSYTLEPTDKTPPRLAQPPSAPARPLAHTVPHTSADPPQDILLPALALLHICLTPELSKGS